MSSERSKVIGLKEVSNCAEVQVVNCATGGHLSFLHERLFGSVDDGSEGISWTTSFKRYCDNVLRQQRCSPLVHLMIKMISSASFCSCSSDIAGSNDTGWFGLLLACKLLIGCVEGVRDARIDVFTVNKLPVKTILAGYREATKHSIEWLLHQRQIASQRAVDSIELLYSKPGQARTSDDKVADNALSEHVIALKSPMHSPESMRAIVRSLLSTVGGCVRCSESAKVAFSATLLEAFVTSTEFSVGDENATSAVKMSMRTNVLLRCAPGFDMEESLLLRNTVAMDIPPIPQHLLLKINSRSSTFQQQPWLSVVLFEDNMEFPVTEARYNDDGVHFEVGVEDSCAQGCSISLESALSVVEQQYLDRVSHLLAHSGVDVVLCQKRIHPYLLRILHNKYGIVCIQRLSNRYIVAMRKLSGATILGSLAALQDPSGGDFGERDESTKIEARFLGRVKSVYNKVIFGSQFVVVDGIDNAESDRCIVSTLFIAGETENDTVELKSAAASVFSALCDAIPQSLPSEDQQRLYLMRCDGSWLDECAEALKRQMALNTRIQINPMDCKVQSKGLDKESIGARLYANALRDIAQLYSSNDIDHSTIRPYSFLHTHLLMLQAVMRCVETILEIDDAIFV